MKTYFYIHIFFQSNKYTHRPVVLAYQRPPNQSQSLTPKWYLTPHPEPLPCITSPGPPAISSQKVSLNMSCRGPSMIHAHRLPPPLSLHSPFTSPQTNQHAISRCPCLQSLIRGHPIITLKDPSLNPTPWANTRKALITYSTKAAPNQPCDSYSNPRGPSRPSHSPTSYINSSHHRLSKSSTPTGFFMFL